MRTMASVCFFVIMLVFVQNVFGNVCTKNENSLTCDECIRCGGEWCRERKLPTSHCVFTSEDGWCPVEREYLPAADDKSTKGIEVNPVSAERTLYVGKKNKLDIQYTSETKAKPKMLIQHSTQSFNIEFDVDEPECAGRLCATTISATPTQDFCNVTGGVSEYVEVKIDVGLAEEVKIKYYVVCACPCSGNAEIRSPVCNRNGNYSCGICICEPGWTGASCEKPICDETKRGDVVQCSLNPRNDEDCYGNGYCGICETCVCYTDREGSQYFDQDNNCAGLCTITNGDYEDCLVNSNGTSGRCYNSHSNLFMQRYNVSLTNERDPQNRKVWVKCNETFDDCGTLEYFAKRDERGDIYVMMVNHCNEIIAEAVVADTKVPIILGVLGIVAAVAAVSGVMLWKHLNTVPPVPLNDPQYQNIDAEDCTGENPLYKPPTSSFKNPTYGKW